MTLCSTLHDSRFTQDRCLVVFCCRFPLVLCLVQTLRTVFQSVETFLPLVTLYYMNPGLLPPSGQTSHSSFFFSFRGATGKRRGHNLSCVMGLRCPTVWTSDHHLSCVCSSNSAVSPCLREVQMFTGRSPLASHTDPQ